MSLPPPAIRIFLEVLVILAAIWDVRTRRIPNWLTLSGVVLGVALNTFLFEINGLWFSLKGLGVAFGVYFVLYLLHAMGAGDVKLMAAVGAAAGPGNWLGILVLTSVAGAVAGLLLVAFKGRFRKTLGNLGILISSLGRGRAPYRETPELDVSSDKAMRLPHGALIALGTLGFLAAALRWAPR
ncbi:MAG TPA: A24 family peptidase [Bryobacteraceae bacterium]|jgi:prepilin peptidase CpaA|nr:A24 family peptidase [Bryobacteraceae bacterium]